MGLCFSSHFYSCFPIYVKLKHFITSMKRYFLTLPYFLLASQLGSNKNELQRVGKFIFYLPWKKNRNSQGAIQKDFFYGKFLGNIPVFFQLCWFFFSIIFCITRSTVCSKTCSYSELHIGQEVLWKGDHCLTALAPDPC